MKNKMIVLLVVVAIAGTGFLGCATKTATTSVPDVDQEVKKQADEIARLQSSVGTLEKELKAKEAMAREQAAAAEIAKKAAAEAEARAQAAGKATTAADTSTAARLSGGGELFPPAAKAGECFARVFVPPVYETATERVLKRQASERIELIPAVYGTADERILVKEASTRLEVIPATYEMVDERVLVKQASTSLVEVPAVYDWVEEKILVEPAHTIWKKGRGPVEKVDNATGEIMCLVDVPAKYNTVRTKVLKTPATTRTTEIPAEYKTVKRKALAKPATTRTIEIPAEYNTVKVRTLVTPPKERRISIPEEYATVTKKVMVSDGKMAWRPVLCETNMNAGTIMDIQRALKAKGFDPGPIDGVYGGRTQGAVRQFQQANKLVTGALTMKTIKALGVNI